MSETGHRPGGSDGTVDHSSLLDQSTSVATEPTSFDMPYIPPFWDLEYIAAVHQPDYPPLWFPPQQAGVPSRHHDPVQDSFLADFWALSNQETSYQVQTGSSFGSLDTVPEVEHPFDATLQGAMMLPVDPFIGPSHSAFAGEDDNNVSNGELLHLPVNSGPSVAISSHQGTPTPNVLVTPPALQTSIASKSPPHKGHPSTSRTRQPNGLFFSNHDEALAIFPKPTWRCPNNDTSIPMTDQERQTWALKLVTAINNTENVHDKPGAVFRKRWYSPSTGPSSYYSRADKELLCWEILDLAERLHSRGPDAFKSFDPAFWKQAARTRDWTFEQRIDKIAELLMFSKARCEKLLAGMSLRTVVANPMVLLSSTKGNAKQNGRRQAFLEVGRAMKKGGLDGDAVEGGDGGTIGSD